MFSIEENTQQRIKVVTSVSIQSSVLCHFLQSTKSLQKQKVHSCCFLPFAPKFYSLGRFFFFLIIFPVKTSATALSLSSLGEYLSVYWLDHLISLTWSGSSLLGHPPPPKKIHSQHKHKQN